MFFGDFTSTRQNLQGGSRSEYGRAVREKAQAQSYPRRGLQLFSLIKAVTSPTFGKSNLLELLIFS